MEKKSAIDKALFVILIPMKLGAERRFVDVHCELLLKFVWFCVYQFYYSNVIFLSNLIMLNECYSPRSRKWYISFLVKNTINEYFEVTKLQLSAA